jgi:hypothetical protein
VRTLKTPSFLRSTKPLWYEGGPEDAIHWPALYDYLQVEKGWDKDTVDSIADSSAGVVASLGNPAKNEFDIRGLVVGHVQSGKTANMTAVIARAVDAGYNLIVILAGLTDTLRHQTQTRLEQDLISRNRYNWHPLTLPNKYDQDGNLLLSGEYIGHTGRRLPNLAADQTFYAVVKKNNAPLKKLIEDIRKTPAPVRNRLRILVIDDEADQASPNAGRTDDDPTPTNTYVRSLLISAAARSYVGYTATPFANILINPWPEGVTDDETGERLDDLYPRDFIIALPKPDRYFGTEQIFGRDTADAEDEGCDGLKVIRDIPPEDAAILSPSQRDIDDFQASLAPSLEDALNYYLMAVAARLSRGHGDQHMTMLLHTSHRIIVHNSTSGVVNDWLDDIKNELASGNVLRRLEALWKRERDAVPVGSFDTDMPLFSEIETHLSKAAAMMEVAVENSPSESRLNFGAKPRAWIAIGGSILSRGLTLEGLMTSYFLRGARQYDTLLQMGRWFGYRPGYEDLIRLWMPRSTAGTYRQLALVEHELRNEIEEYVQRDATPVHFATRIRTLPGLQVTARNKMRHASTANIDYFGLHLQTIRFVRSAEDGVLSSNWNAAGKLLSRIGAGDSSPMSTEVPVEYIISFLQEYQVHSTHRDLSGKWLSQFIDRNREKLSTWSVVLVQPKEANAVCSSEPLGPIAHPALVRRSRLDPTESGSEEVANIKALMSRRDVLADLCPEDLPQVSGWSSWGWPKMKSWRENATDKKPLLLLYPIDKNSPAKEGSDTRTSLDAECHVLGIGLVFPEIGTVRGRRPVAYISINLPEEHGDAEEDDENSLSDTNA